MFAIDMNSFTGKRTSFHLIRSLIALMIKQMVFPVRVSKDKTELDPLSPITVIYRVTWQSLLYFMSYSCL